MSRSIAFERMFSTFVDLGDCSCAPVDYRSGRRIDVDYYRRKEEVGGEWRVVESCVFHVVDVGGGDGGGGGISVVAAVGSGGYSRGFVCLLVA